MKLRRKYIPFLSRILNGVNDDIERCGVQNAFFNVLRKNGSRLTVSGITQDLEKILTKERVILVSNHPHQVEPFFLIASLPSRQDMFVVICIMFVNWLSNLNKHLIPVHIRHRFGVKERYSLRHRVFTLLPQNKQVPYEQAHSENLANMSQASKYVDRGGMVIIFPGSDKAQWFSGIGFLLKNTSTKDPIYYVKAHINGTNKLDLFRIIPGISRLFPVINIDFAPAKQVNDLKRLDGKEITRCLEKDYRRWEAKINQLI